MQIAVLVAGVAFLKKAIDFVKYLANFDEGKNGVVTQLTTWAAGALGSLLLFTQHFAQQIDVVHTQAGHLGGAVQAAIGVLLASVGSIFHDYQKARDSTDSSRVPPLVKSSPRS